MENNLIPVGNRIIVKALKKEKVTAEGLYIPNQLEGEQNGNSWGLIVALPVASSNPSILQMKVGGEVLYKRFQADKAITRLEASEFEVIDVEPESGVRPGQVLAYLPPKDEG